MRYAYDTRVPHHAHVRVGDLAVVRDDKWVLGAGWIDYIQITPAVKIIQRCPECHRARDYKLRYKEWPPYRCAACLALFEVTEKFKVEVQSYTADYSRTFRLVDGYFPVSELKPAYLNRSVMTSIRQLDLAGLRPLLREYLAISDVWWRSDRADPAGGYKPTTGRTRVGQQHFREEMLARFGEICAFTGHQPPEALEAAHLYAYSKTPSPRLEGRTPATPRPSCPVRPRTPHHRPGRLDHRRSGRPRPLPRHKRATRQAASNPGRTAATQGVHRRPREADPRWLAVPVAVISPYLCDPPWPRRRAHHPWTPMATASFAAVIAVATKTGAGTPQGTSADVSTCGRRAPRQATAGLYRRRCQRPTETPEKHACAS